MDLQQLFEEILPGNRLPAQQVTSVTCDSRQVRRGSVFVCIAGSLTDGHNYVVQALQRGAILVVAQRDCGVPNQLLFPDTRIVYARLCAAFFGYPARKLKLLGVTGTNGKTTTAWLTHHALIQLGVRAGLIGTICNRVGEQSIPARYTTPDAWELQELLAQMLQCGCTHVVMEASSQALEQKRLYGCFFACAAFTNLTPEHLDYHGDVESYFQAKRELFSQCGAAAVNTADAYGQRLYRELTEWGEYPVAAFGSSETELYAENISLQADRCSCTVCYNGKRCEAILGLPGSFSVENMLTAVGLLLHCGYSLQESVAALCSCKGVPGRTEVCLSQDGITVIRDYAHTPDSLTKVLQMLRGFCKGRLLTVFGCPGRRDRTKRPLMLKAVCQGADLVVMTADNPREEPLEQIFEDALAGFCNDKHRMRVIPDRREAILWALQNCRGGDILLLAGKGHEDYQVLADRTVYFDECQIVQEGYAVLQSAQREGKNGGRILQKKDFI